MLDPDVVMRVDRGTLSRETRGAEEVARQAVIFNRLAPLARPAMVNGAPGFVVADAERVYAVAGFTIAGGVITEIDLLADPTRLSKANLRGLAP